MDESVVDFQPEGERWDPLGAPDDQKQAFESKDARHECSHRECPLEKLRSLEEEQEALNSSLLALTTHFAQVQFRLRQIVNAPTNDKEDLLKSLEEFAFRGVPEVKLVHGELCMSQTEDAAVDEQALAKAMQVKRCRQTELIEQLKYQLRELESYAFEMGEAGLPQDVLFERQRVVLDELKTKMNLDVGELQPRQISIDELRSQVQAAVGNIVSPLKMKEHLVNQLKTQVADLERFIQFLQADVDSKQCSCHKVHGHESRDLHDSIHMVKRAATLLQMFALVQFGCGPQQFRKNDLKTTMKVNHWGDMRARLQMTVMRILEMGSRDEPTGDYSSDADDSPAVLCNVKLTKAVRKQLATGLRDLMQHGLSVGGQSVSLVPFMGCFARKTGYTSEDMHAWELIMEYYALKNGDRYNATPARKLSQSFNLDIVGATAISNKQSLLSAIGTILSSHSPYKRGNDSHFKAFVCAALNCKKLVVWLRLVYQCKHLVHKHYQPWSYAIQTSFQDTLQCLDALSSLDFDLPVDLAVRQFQTIKDVFT